MSLSKFIKRALLLAAFFGCVSGAIGDSVAAPARNSIRQTAKSLEAVRSGVNLELSGDWLDALHHYEEAVKNWPGNEELKSGLRRSKIHFSIERRYTDRSFETKLLTKSRRESLILFDAVLESVTTKYVNIVHPTSFVAHGTESLYRALSNEKFIETNLRGVDAGRIESLRRLLLEKYWNRRIADRIAARQTVDEVCGQARKLVGLSGSAVVMEYMFGGFNALDDYSNFLTPDRWEDLYGNIEGEFVGIGIEMKSEMGKGLHLINVLPDSPASQGGLLPGDYIIGIDGADCRRMTTDEAARLLRGSSGSRVQLKAKTPDTGHVRQGPFTRRTVQVKSIPEARIIDKVNGIAYIRMTGFQKKSPRELDEALLKLHRQGMRALIWDVRGNPGGLLDEATEVLDRFIADGVLVSTHGRLADQNKRYTARRIGTWKVPLVLLVDGDSASASEIVAGAVRDHRRALIVGRQTFGKWSVQTILPIRGSAGLRLTTAKFYSPHGHTLGKVGVKPDVVIAMPNDSASGRRGTAATTDIDGDADIQKGIEILSRQLSRR